MWREEHAWTAALGEALAKDGADDTARVIADAFPHAGEMSRFMPADAEGINLAIAPTASYPASNLGRTPMTYRDWVAEH